MPDQVATLKMKARRTYERTVTAILPTGAGLRWGLRRHYRFYDRLAQKAERKGDLKAARDLRDEAWGTARPEEAELNLWETLRWRRRARRYLVPLPPDPPHNEDNEWWERDEINRLILTHAGKSLIWKRVRGELKWRHERWARWAQVVISLLAAGAALIGGYLGARAGR